jgi:hypothetical protein
MLAVCIEMYIALVYKGILKEKSGRFGSGMYISFVVLERIAVAHMVSERTAMTIEEVLVKEYGPLLSLAELAMILDRSPDGLRISLKSSSEWVRRINAARLRLGRRVYFRTSGLQPYWTHGDVEECPLISQAFSTYFGKLNGETDRRWKLTTDSRRAPQSRKGDNILDSSLSNRVRRKSRLC